VKIQNIFHGQSNITCSTNCKCRTAATLHALETVRFRYITVNALHKGDDDNDDNNNNNNNTCDWKLLKIIAENISIKPNTGNARSVACLADDSY